MGVKLRLFRAGNLDTSTIDFSAIEPTASQLLGELPFTSTWNEIDTHHHIATYCILSSALFLAFVSTIHSHLASTMRPYSPVLPSSLTRIGGGGPD